MGFVIKPCAGGTVFVINFGGGTSSNAAANAAKTGKKGFDFSKILCAVKKGKGKFSAIVETPQILLLKWGVSEITVYKSGKILAKNVNSAEDAEKLASDFEKLIYPE